MFVRMVQVSVLSVFASGSIASAASFASGVVAYTPGEGAGIYNNPAAALGAPSALTGENESATPSFGVNVLSPFSPAYQSDEIVRVGEGGSITLRLERYIHLGAGAEFGLIENVSLIDPDYPSGTTTNPAVVFGADNALVEVSHDGVNFVGLTGGAPTDTLFDMPAIYFNNAGAFDIAEPASPVVADFGKPFSPAGGVSVFDGKSSYAEVIAAFDGSAGGTWLDVSASGLESIGYIRFSVPDDGDDSTLNTLDIDAILTNSALLGGVVPEPASALAILAPAFVARRRR